MAFDYKKEYKEFYLPSRKPHLITVPPMNFVTVQGKGDPNDPAGEYQAAMEVLYGLAYTIKMSYKGSHRMEGFFEYVVPPLEGLWHQQGVDGVDYAHKETFEWTSMIRLPEFGNILGIQNHRHAFLRFRNSQLGTVQALVLFRHPV